VGAILPFYDEVHSSKIKHILVRHEQGAVHAAEGYAKATGKLGMCIATSGPGATNLITGITDAKMDSVPLLALTGQVGDGRHRHRRVSRMRHLRYDDTDHEI
jgi:acetolactate synthase-1/2/3 large subunit